MPSMTAVRDKQSKKAQRAAEEVSLDISGLDQGDSEGDEVDQVSL